MEDSNDVTRVGFARPIDYKEVRSFLKYLIVNFGTEININAQIESHEYFGNRFSEKPKTIEGVVEKVGHRWLLGTITGKSPLNSASFSSKNSYDDEDNPIYRELRFDVTPGYDPGELSSDDVRIMKEVGELTTRYFSENSENC